MTIDLSQRHSLSSRGPVFSGRTNPSWRWFSLACAFVFGIGVQAQTLASAPPSTSTRVEATPLAFAEFFDPSAKAIKPSARLLALAGQRVKLVGFMTKMEVAPKGAFYLASRPVSCDEEGGGTADLPPEAVYVVVRSSAGQEIPYTPRALEVTGLLEVGYHVEEDERVTHIRLLLDRPQDLLGSMSISSTTPQEVHP